MKFFVVRRLLLSCILLWVQIYITIPFPNYPHCSHNVILNERCYVEFKEMINQVKGVFKYPEKIDQKTRENFKRSVLLTIVSKDEMDLVKNFDCYMKKFELNYLVIALDERTFDSLPVQLNNAPVYLSHFLERHKNDSQSYLSKLQHKLEIVHDLLHMGLDVLYSEPDVTFARNPLPYLISRKEHYLHISDQRCGRVRNTSSFLGGLGFYHVRRGRAKPFFLTYGRSPSLLGASVSHSPANLPGTEFKVSKQEHCQHFLNPRNFSQTMFGCNLDPCVFISHKDYQTLTHRDLTALQKLNKTPAMFHWYDMPNHPALSKIESLKKKGLWITDLQNDGSSVCSLPLTQIEITESERKAQGLKELKPILEEVKGIYQYPEKVDSKLREGLKNTILFVVANKAFIDQVKNFDCYMQRLKYKYFVIALEQSAFTQLKKEMKVPVVMSYLASTAAEGSFFPGTIEYSRIVKAKVKLVYDIMSLGYDVFFSDTDIAIARDPLPYMAVFQNVDYVHSPRPGCGQPFEYGPLQPFVFEGNTGFYLIRSNPQTLKWYRKVMKHWGWDYTRRIDQEIFWRATIKMLDPKLAHHERCHDLKWPNDFPVGKSVEPKRDAYISACMLNRCLFSARGVVSNETYELLTAELKKMGETPLMMHANAIHGDEAKLAALKNFGLWIVDVNRETGAYTCRTPRFKNF